MKIDNITLTYGNKVVLKDIDINIDSWEFVFLIGYSWSWKTSLIRSLIWDFKPITWDIILDNNLALYRWLNEENLLKHRRNIWIIFQDFKLFETKKVFENVAFAMEICWYSDELIRRKVPEALDKVGLLIKKDKFIYELSWWEKQRVAIARALVHEPDMIIADEPTWNLDPNTSDEIMEILNDINKDWKTIIIATHDKHIVNNAWKRVISFENKTIVSDEKKWDYFFN